VYNAYIYRLTRFPYRDKDPEGYATLMKTIYTLTWDDGKIATPIGYVTETVLKNLAKIPTSIRGDLEVRSNSREITIFHQATETERSQKAAATVDFWKMNQDFGILSRWRSELYPVYGPKNELLYSIQRSASPLFGVVAYGVHMTAYVRSPESSHGIKIWIPKRAVGKSYGGMLGNTVAGGKITGEDPFECLIREAEARASLDKGLIERSSTSHGTVKYISIRSAQATGETESIQPKYQYVYDLELPADVIPTTNDKEVEEFFLWNVEEVRSTWREENSSRAAHLLC
jgi:8-oxo-dGTP pyrophosphatase MutT (NUDIX family)